MADQKATRVAVFGLLTLLLVAAVALFMANLHSGFGEGAHLVVFDEDYSNSVFGWMIAIPVLIIVAIFTAVVLAGAGVVVIGALAMAAVATVVALLFAILISVLPVVVFFAIPVLAIVGLMKLLKN